MAWLRNLPVHRKFTYAFGTVCGLCILLGAYTFFTFRGIAAKSVDVSDNALPALVALADVRGSINSVRREDLELLLCQTPACSTDHGAKRQKAIETYQNSVKAYEPRISYPGEGELFQKFSFAFSQYLDASSRAGSLLAAAKTGDALDLLASDSVMTNFNTTLATVSEDLNLNAKHGTEESTTATLASNRATWINLGVADRK